MNKSLLSLSHRTTDSVQVHREGKRLGSFIKNLEGAYCFWPSTNFHGFFDREVLVALLAQMDVLNDDEPLQT